MPEEESTEIHTRGHSRQLLSRCMRNPLLRSLERTEQGTEPAWDTTAAIFPFATWSDKMAAKAA